MTWLNPRWTVVVALCLLVLTSCVSGASGQGTNKGSVGGNLNVRLIGDWDTFDPSGNTIPTMTAQEIITGVYDRLVENLPGGGAAPELAKSWKISNGTTVVFDLRSDVTCSDGTPLTATAVANSFSRLVRSAIVSTVFGSTAQPRIKADDAAHTLEFEWPAPNLDAFYGFGTAYASVICPAGLANPSKLRDTAYGTGPYVVSSAVHAVSVSLTKNPAWKWGPSGITARDMPDSLSFKVLTNDTTAANELITGDLDVAAITGADVARLAANKSLIHLMTPSFKLAVLMMNQTQGHPTTAPQLRRAIMTAVAPADWNQAALGGRGVTGTSIFLKQATCYESGTAKLMPKTSIAAAKQILSDAGYTAGSDGKLTQAGKQLTLSLLGTPETFGRGTEYIASQLTALGINLSITDSDRATYVTRLRAGTWDVTTGTGTSANVPSNLLVLRAGPVPPQGVNTAYTVDPVLNDDLAAGLAAANQTAACQAWSKFQLDLLRNYDMLPLAALTSDLFTRPKIALVDVQGQFDTASMRRVP